MHRRTNALARELRRAGISEGDGVAIMCRNHRGFIEATVACSKLGAGALYLNTAFAGPQITDVLEREDPVAVIYDEEFSGLVSDGAARRIRFIAWREPAGPSVHTPAVRPSPLLEELIARGDDSDLRAARGERARGDPDLGNHRHAEGRRAQPEPTRSSPAAALFSKIPLRAPRDDDDRRADVPLLGVRPLHDSVCRWARRSCCGGGSTPRRRSGRSRSTGASALVVVPVMLQRILDLPPETIARYDVRCLRVIAVSGSALPGELATRAMDTFGDVLYNLYGSTEVAWATIATPEDLRAAPGTAGRPPMGTVVKLLDAEGREVRPGEGGRIFVANEMMFEGYTDGGGKEIVRGLMSTGDVGRFDADGRLFVDGRDDEMIVSGGENVFPREVEDLLADHGEIEEVAVVGVEDEEFGQRLKAFVVVREGAELTAEAVQDYVKENLARYKVPREVVFVAELPRNATGKVLKRELKTHS